MNAIDLFSGAGGLTFGFYYNLINESFVRRDNVEFVFSNEYAPQAVKAFKKNYGENIPVIAGDICDINDEMIEQYMGDQEVDIIIGGPPCQGFSNANRQKNTAISQNNMLVKQYLRAILELQPKAFVMENVSMLRSEVHRFYMEKGDEALVKRCKIPVKDTPLCLLDAEFMFDEALDIVQNEETIRQFLWDEDDYATLNVIYKATKNTAKLKKALDKHKAKLLRNAELHLKAEGDHHIHISFLYFCPNISRFYLPDCITNIGDESTISGSTSDGDYYYEINIQEILQRCPNLTFYGEAGSGKTNICLQTAYNVVSAALSQFLTTVNPLE